MQRIGKPIGALLALVLLVVLLVSPLISKAFRQPLTVLLMGTDNLGDLVTDDSQISRADALFLLTIHPGSKQIRVLSIERDYLVDLPDDRGQNKLATATFFGGPQMALDAVNGLFGLQVSLYAQIELKNLVTAVDAIGGLPLDISPEELPGVNEFISGIAPFDLPLIPGPGVNHLDGNQAWAFMASREMSQDSVGANQLRVSRQMRVIQAGAAQLQAMGATQIMEMMDQLLPLVQTNLSLYDLMGFTVGALAANLDETAYQYTPQSGYNIKLVNMHRVVVPDDMAKEQQLVADFLYR